MLGNRIENIRKLIISSILLFICLSGGMVWATNARINSVTMNPPSPNFGQLVTITIDYCSNLYQTEFIDVAFSTSPTFQPATSSGLGQVFVVYGTDAAGTPIIDVPSSVPGGVTNNYIGALGNTPNGYIASPPCSSCGGTNDGQHYLKTYVVHVPGAENFPGCTNTKLYVLVGLKDSNMNGGDWAGLPAACVGDTDNSVSWNIPIMNTMATINKRAEGVLQQVGDLVLYSIDYEFANGPLTIDDPLPGGGNLQVVSWGPVNNAGVVTVGGTGAFAGATSGDIQWTFPTRAGKPGSAVGTVWVLMSMKNAIAAGTVINNTATANGSITSTAPITIGQAVMTIQKSSNIANGDSAKLGDMITYYLEYDVNGYQLKSYSPFDNLPLGVMAPSPAVGWKSLPDTVHGNTAGTWNIVDPCTTGDRYIEGSNGGTEGYPALLLDDPNGNTLNDQMCLGIVESDVLIEPNGFDGADGLVILRNNGLTGAAGEGYSLLVSIDNNPAAGYVAIQRFPGSTTPPAGNWYNGGVTTNVAGITGNKWFSTLTQMTQVGNDYVFQVKVWPKGDPEPNAWTMTWTDIGAAVDPNWKCDGTGTYKDWRPGVGEQNGNQGATKDCYNNFATFIPRVVANTTIYDTEPTGVSYSGSGPAASSTTGGVVTWNLNNVSNQSGTLTWWGPVTSCNPITNTANMSGGAPAVNIRSNQVVINVICGTPTVTVTNTPSMTPSPTSTNTPSRTPTTTNTQTSTPTFTSTATLTITPSNSSTPTKTITNTATPTNTITSSPTQSITYTSTPTNTPTSTFTSTNSVTPTNTPSPTITQTSWESMTVTPTVTETLTSTPTATQTVTYTGTPTASPSCSNTPTDTTTITYTDTPTVTPTSTFTNTSSMTPTITDTLQASSTDTPTATPTFTITNTATPTDTVTASPSSTPTFTVTNTDTFTFTTTSTPSCTPTFTITNTWTPTVTFTCTSTVTNTNTPTPTATTTFTPTSTPTVTPTLPPFPYILTIGVYNSAGELVKTIANTPANALLSIVNIMTANKPTGPNDTVTSVTNTVVNTQQDLQLYLGGLQTPLTVGSNATTFTWDETTNASQIVSTGEYYIKFEEKDQFGHTNILIKEVQVIKVEQFVQLNIYNSGGEIVRSEKVDLVGVINDTDKVTLGIGGTNPDMVEISQDKLPVTFIYGPNIGQNVSWDGLNSNGMAVSSGTYEVQVIVKTNQGKQVEASKTIIILNNSTKSLSSVLVLPNPLKFGVDKSAKIGWMGTGTSKVRISIYNPSGEAVRFLSGKMSPSGIGNVSTGSINWDMRTSGNVLVAQGYYILIAESDNDQGHIDRKIIKFAIK